MGRLQQGGLGGDCVVVLVNQLLLVDILGGQLALFLHLDVLRLELLLHERLARIGDSVRLQEHEGAVFHHLVDKKKRWALQGGRGLGCFSPSALRARRDTKTMVPVG